MVAHTSVSSIPFMDIVLWYVPPDLVKLWLHGRSTRCRWFLWHPHRYQLAVYFGIFFTAIFTDGLLGLLEESDFFDWAMVCTD
jgi:hypothetical protein